MKVKRPLRPKAILIKLAALVVVLYIWFVMYSGLTPQ